jgi:hypothetical protein
MPFSMSGEVLFTRTHDCPVVCLTHAAGKGILATGAGTIVYLWDSRTGEVGLCSCLCDMDCNLCSVIGTLNMVPFSHVYLCGAVRSSR